MTHLPLLLWAWFLQAVPAAPAVGNPPAIPDSFTSMVTLNMIFVWAIQALKKSKYFTWITVETQTVNKLASVVTASLGAAGISLVYQHPGPGVFNFAITGLTLGALGHWAWHVAANYAIQKGEYKVAFGLPELIQQLLAEQKAAAKP